MENAPARILIIDTAWLGDVVFTTALLGAVRRLWPQAEIHVVVAPRGEPILQGHPHVNHLWVFDKSGEQKSAAALVNFAAALHKERFDLILCAHPSFRSRLLTRLVGAPVRVGYRGFGSRLCFTHTVVNDLAMEPDHARRRIALLKPLGIETTPAPLSVPVHAEQRQRAAQFLKQHRLDGKPLLGLVPGSAWETKRWPAECYRDLAQRWVTEREGRVLVFGGDAETEIIRIICGARRDAIVPVINEPIPFVAGLLSRCCSVMGNDTGVSFLAVAVGGPRVCVLFGCTQVDYAFSPPHRAITAGVPCCLPRTGHGAHRCRWADEPWCMAQIGVERVWRAVTD